MKEIDTSQSATEKLIVKESDTAQNMGSGTIRVLATPCLLALMEKATVSCVAPFMEGDETTVGCEINISHLKPSAVGEKIWARAQIKSTDGRRITFNVYAQNENGDIIGKGTIERVVVNSQRFLSKLY